MAEPLNPAEQDQPEALSQAADNARQWAKAFLTDLLKRWNNAIAGGNGLFLPDLDRGWNVVQSERPMTLVSQCRLIYTMAVGYRLTGEEAFLGVTLRGMEAFERYFKIGDPAEYCWSVKRDGTRDVIDVNAYGYAFIILAQATTADVLDEPSLASSALGAWEFMHESLSDKHGGLRWHRPIHRPDIPVDANSQNPLMHAFEALMALTRCTAATQEVSTSARQSAKQLLDFMMQLADFKGGLLIEWFSKDWKPQTLAHGGFVDIGHGFEWAFLLSEWYALTGDQVALANGIRFLETAITIGLDNNGAVKSTAAPDGSILSETHGLWQQCEGVRTLCRYATAHRHPLAVATFPKALAYYRNVFVDNEHGGVFAGPVVDGILKSDHKGDSWKLDYHSTNMLLEIIK